VQFNKFEKVAGLFVAVACLGCVAGMAGIAVKNGWLASKIIYSTELETADGVHPGTAVQIAGMHVGSVTKVDLQGNDKVFVEFEVLEKFRSKIRQDSHVIMFRPFILSDKVFEISVGSESSTELEAHAAIPMQASMDIMDFLSGKKMGSVLGSFDKLADSLRIVGESFADPRRTKALVKMLDRLAPLVENLSVASGDIVKITSAATKQKRVEVLLDNLTKFTVELAEVLPAFSNEAPNVGQQLGQIVNNLNVLTNEMQKLTPAIAVIAPELPRTSRRAVEALDETVVLLKALQKSWLLSGKVEQVRKEESQRDGSENRKPAETEK
jgi:phospholipid/cholesterol/gamma-HCH transport system substrate-binding protein